MNGWHVVAVLLGAVLAVSLLVYAVLALWPQRIPKHTSVQGIRRRIEAESGDEPIE